MDRIRRRLILLLCVFSAFALACGDYSGGDSSGSSETTVLAGAGLGGLSQTEQVAAFQGTVYPLLSANCNGCHAGFGPGTPHVAHSNAAVAYSAVVDNQKVNV